MGWLRARYAAPVLAVLVTMAAVPVATAEEAVAANVVPASVEASGLVATGTLNCILRNALVSYIMFEPSAPLLCDFRARPPGVSGQYRLHIVAQVEGAPTDRETVLTWTVFAPAAEKNPLSGDYGLQDDKSLSNGTVVLVPAAPVQETIPISALMTAPDTPPDNRPAPKPVPTQNMARWVAEMRL